MAELERRRLQFDGTIQGVGFRPTVWNLAHELQLGGFVRNDCGSVTVEVQGPPPRVEQFCEQLTSRLPAHARIDSLVSSSLECTQAEAFTIQESQAQGVGVAIGPDLAPCPDCLSELGDPEDRRFAYPFLNCTACGPRYTIVNSLPYDRARTTMNAFPLCPACRREYEDPRDRRFHAQPLACPECGPAYTRECSEVAALLVAGEIVALKGVGGYHLLCQVSQAGRLRQRKHRPHRPLVLMVPDLASAREWVELDQTMGEFLESPARPILIAPARRPPGELAPGQRTLGVMLPYTGAHHLLCQEPLVVTSANLPGQPICIEAEPILEQLADTVVHHNRTIAVACDDSVYQWGPRGPVPLRRSRGVVPAGVDLHPSLQGPVVLALGGEMKATLALALPGKAWMSGHVGEVENLETLQRLEQQAEHLQRLVGERAQWLAADLHPGSLSSSWAARQGLPLVLVQHHHAHLASLLAEHGRPPCEQVLGFVFDGTGWGSDDTLWGGELLLGGYADFERLDHFAGMPLRGGDAAVRNPARLALETLQHCGVELDERLPCVAAASELERANLGRQPGLLSSSLGRLFDVVAALLGVCQRVSYEGQAASELEAVCVESHESMRVDWNPAEALAELSAALLRGLPVGLLATRFHNGLADLVLRQALLHGRGRAVGLTGGCFQNLRLLRACLERLESAGFEVLIHRQVPANDGGLALGQAVVAQSRAKGG